MLINLNIENTVTITVVSNFRKQNLQNNVWRHWLDFKNLWFYDRWVPNYWLLNIGSSNNLDSSLKGAKKSWVFPKHILFTNKQNKPETFSIDLPWIVWRISSPDSSCNFWFCGCCNIPFRRIAITTAWTLNSCFLYRISTQLVMIDFIFSFLCFH
jgi:hypothetical protein